MIATYFSALRHATFQQLSGLPVSLSSTVLKQQPQRMSSEAVWKDVQEGNHRSVHNEHFRAFATSSLRDCWQCVFVIGTSKSRIEGVQHDHDYYEVLDTGCRQAHRYPIHASAGVPVDLIVVCLWAVTGLIMTALVGVDAGSKELAGIVRAAE
jgi:hypothetical protein